MLVIGTLVLDRPSFGAVWPIVWYVIGRRLVRDWPSFAGNRNIGYHNEHRQKQEKKIDDHKS
ncbi:hypothetical protein BLOT_011670 [Blomia tropicalis]|nr:hypothetical protein BLOT_011670 [Blomia tropicalis]